MNLSDIYKQTMRLLDSGSYELALSTLYPLVEKGHTPSILYYGDILLDSEPDKGKKFLSTYAEQGLSEAYLRLAINSEYFADEPLEQNTLDFLKKAAQQNNIQALFILLDLFWDDESKFDYLEQLRKIAPELINDFSVFLKRHGLDFDSVSGQSITNSVHQEGNISVHSGILSPVTCFYIITRFASLMKPAKVIDHNIGQSLHHDIRTSLYCSISMELIDWFTLRVDKTVSKLLGHDVECGESLSLISYKEGQEYKNHYDSLPEPNDKKQWNLDGAQRVKTAICYLNDDIQGGATSFAKLGLNIQPKMGSVLSFDNVDEKLIPIKGTYHAGEPVKEGVKWVVTKWVRQFPTPYGRVVYKRREKY